MKICAFGGCFAPPHIAHLKIALAAIEQIRPDIFYFIPDYFFIVAEIFSANHQKTIYNISRERGFRETVKMLRKMKA